MAAGDQNKQLAEIDQQIDKLQKEIERLSRERLKASQAVQESQHRHVKAAIPSVLSRDAVGQLRQITLQNMRLSEVLLNAKIRERLDLNDEQVKKIQEISEKRVFQSYSDIVYPQIVNRTTVMFDAIANRTTVTGPGGIDMRNYGYWHVAGGDEAYRSALLKLLTPQQREALERLSGLKMEVGK